MDYDRKSKGASSFLESTRRLGGGVFDVKRGIAGREKPDGDDVILDTRVLRFLGKTKSSDLKGIAQALHSPLPDIKNASSRLLDNGFLEVTGEDETCKLTEAGLRAIRYTKLAEF